MDIIVTSKNQRPNNFSSNFIDSISLADNFEIAVKGIFHGPTYNITESNNTFRIFESDVTETLKIVPGFYANTCEVLKAMQDECLRNEIDSRFQVPDAGKVVLKLPKPAKLITGGKQDTLMRIFGFCEYDDESKLVYLNQLNIENHVLENQSEVAFLYSSVVANMTINQQQSHLLSCFPIKSQQGYNYHEITNPMYRPLAVHAFIDLHFLLTDIEGRLLEFADLPTVIILNIRKVYPCVVVVYYKYRIHPPLQTNQSCDNRIIRLHRSEPLSIVLLTVTLVSITIKLVEV